MLNDAVITQAYAFLEEQWDTVLNDLRSLVRIDSHEDCSAAAPGAPFGPGPRAALDEAARIMASYGFELHDCEGYCGYADIPGESEKQLGIIGHLDVVPAGIGWTYPAFDLTQKDGFLFGRGVTDDKGPFLMAIHALRFWRDRYAREGRAFPVNVRVIFGCSEETGMADADYYLAHFDAPDFLFTPDADFPLCYGEKGQYQVRVESPLVRDGRIVSFTGGTVVNGVPAQAEALVWVEGVLPPAAPRITLEVVEEADAEGAAVQETGTVPSGAAASNVGRKLLRIRAAGIQGHAAMPEGSLNAIDLLAAYLLENGLCNEEERSWLEFVRCATATTDGEGFGIACADEDFGPLTCVGGVATSVEEEPGLRRFTQSIDVRFPVAISLSALHEQIEQAAASVGASVVLLHEVEPLLVSPTSPEIKALLSAYEDVTGVPAKPFTMGGGTYAHHFPCAVSFGAIDEGRFPPQPGVGGMHAADEGVIEESLKQALVIYIVALGRLFALDW